ncbi:MAG: nuclear transport factor 2 family protein [Candidatus Acidiferrales bacterium]
MNPRARWLLVFAGGLLMLAGTIAFLRFRVIGANMRSSHNISIPEMTDAIQARLLVQWEAWKHKDKPSNDAVIAENFHAFGPDGSLRAGRPTVQQMIDEPITGYKLSQFRVVPVGADAALVTYIADVTLPGDKPEFHMAVGEVWKKRNGQWLIYAFSGTPLK